MMTDKEKLAQCFKEIGIKFKETAIKGQDPRYGYDGECQDTQKAVCQIEIESGIGYVDFTCDFYFDENGKFLGHGVWE